MALRDLAEKQRDVRPARFDPDRRAVLGPPNLGALMSDCRSRHKATFLGSSPTCMHGHMWMAKLTLTEQGA